MTCSGATWRYRSRRSRPLQTDVSKKTPWMPPRRPASPAMSAIPACATISLHALVPPHERLEILRDRRKPAAAVDEDGHGPLDGEREDRLEPLVAECERLRARMQLDPARSEVEAAPRFLEGLGGEVEPDEWEKRPARALGVGERPVVRAP